MDCVLRSSKLDIVVLQVKLPLGMCPQHISERWFKTKLLFFIFSFLVMSLGRQQKLVQVHRIWRSIIVLNWQLDSKMVLRDSHLLEFAVLCHSLPCRGKMVCLTSRWSQQKLTSKPTIVKNTVFILLSQAALSGGGRLPTGVAASHPLKRPAKNTHHMSKTSRKPLLCSCKAVRGLQSSHTGAQRH